MSMQKYREHMTKAEKLMADLETRSGQGWSESGARHVESLSLVLEARLKMAHLELLSFQAQQAKPVSDSVSLVNDTPPNLDGF